MDFFEQFMFDELVELYSRDSLESYEYDDIYERFTHLEHCIEVKPYLYAMRFLGKGTKAEPDSVLRELESLELSSNNQVRGLYLDIKLVMKKGNASDIEELDKCVEAGYSDKYLKDASYLCSEDANQEEDDDECEDDTDNYYTDEDEKVRFRSMIFEGCGYSGYRFTSGDIDYLNAKVFIEPIKKACTLSVRSQIYDGNEPFSKVFSNEYQLKPGDTWFQTTGWGNKNFYAYENKTYQWRVEFDGKDVYSQDFYFYNGKIKKSGVPVKDVKLFASKASGALEADRDKYSMAFKRESLEYVYFKLFIEEPGQDTVVQIFLKVICLEDDSVFYDKYILHHLEADTYACWNGIGFNQKGKWKAGSQRNEQYKSWLEETTKARCRKINKSIAIFVFIVVIIMTVVFGIIKYNDYLKKMDAEVQPNNSTYTQNKEVTDSSKQNDLTEYILPNSNSEYISYSDLEGLSQTEVSLARNEIYARHGRKFETDSIREYFEMKTWYEPSIDSDNFSESVFNNYEKDNIKESIKSITLEFSNNTELSKVRGRKRMEIVEW